MGSRSDDQSRPLSVAARPQEVYSFLSLQHRYDAKKVRSRWPFSPTQAFFLRTVVSKTIKFKLYSTTIGLPILDSRTNVLVRQSSCYVGKQSTYLEIAGLVFNENIGMGYEPGSLSRP